MRPEKPTFFQRNPQLRITHLWVEDNINKIKNQKLNSKNTNQNLKIEIEEALRADA